MDGNVSSPSSAPNRAQRRAAARRRVAAVGSAAVLASATAAVVTGTAGVASAAGYSVTTCADSGAGSLRQAITDAAAHDGPDVITITATCTTSGPVAVGSEMDVTDSGGGDSLTINGPGADAFVLDGVGSPHIFYVGSSTSVTLSGVTLQHADASAFRASGSGAVEFDGVVFAYNDGYQGGGASLYNPDSLTITDTTFVGNSSADRGGGLYVQASVGPVTISSSTFAGNTAVGEGGGVLVYDSPGDVQIANTTFSGNSASRGGGLYADLRPGSGDLEVLFCTFADNEASSDGAGGLQVREGHVVTMIGSLFAGNTADSGVDEVYVAGVLGTTEHENLFEGTVGGFTPDATDLTGVDPLLGPLADNGGPTQTRALGAGSPAIDAGPVSFPPFPGDTSDQRGTPWSRVYGGRSDIGALEVQPDPTPPTPGPAPGPDPEPTFTG